MKDFIAGNSGTGRSAGYFLSFISSLLLLALLLLVFPSQLISDGQQIFPANEIELPASILYAFSGVALSMALMSILFWFWLRDPLYIHFATLLVVGLVFKYLRYDRDDFSFFGAAERAYASSIVYCIVCYVATTFFSRLFEFRRNAVWAWRFFRWVACFNLVALLIAIFGYYADISRVVVFVALSSTLFGAFFVVYLIFIRRQWQYFLGAASFSVPTFFALLSLLRSNGVLPDSVHLDLPALWFVGRLTEVLLLSAAVANRTVMAERALHQERNAALRKALAAEYELEEKVRLRTRELVRLQNELKLSLDSEREMRQEQRQFFNMVNHEFRTPLAVINIVATEQQSFPCEDVSVQKEQASQILKACRRLTGLVDNCLMSDRLDTDAAFALQLDWTPVREIVMQAAQLVQWSRRHHLKIEIDDGIDDWECDATLVGIAFSDIVDNAVKYAVAGEIMLSAKLDAQGDLLISVSDEGPGLSSEMTGRIFNLYERGEQGAKTPGFGLGLWVARRVAVLHGGDLSVSTSEKGGACFTLKLSRRFE